MLNLSVMMTVKMRRKIFLTLGPIFQEKTILGLEGPFQKLCRTYVRPDLHRIGDHERRVNNIYYKAYMSISNNSLITYVSVYESGY